MTYVQATPDEEISTLAAPLVQVATYRLDIGEIEYYMHMASGHTIDTDGKAIQELVVKTHDGHFFVLRGTRDNPTQTPTQIFAPVANASDIVEIVQREFGNLLV